MQLHQLRELILALGAPQVPWDCPQEYRKEGLKKKKIKLLLNLKDLQAFREGTHNVSENSLARCKAALPYLERCWLSSKQ